MRYAISELISVLECEISFKRPLNLQVNCVADQDKNVLYLTCKI